jgi:tetratricopeptide (TPR) repeat protein
MRPGVLRAGLLLILLAASLPALQAGFQFDDFRAIVADPAAHDLGTWARHLPGLRPLLKLSYALTWRLSPTPFAFHLGNVLIHVANGWLVFELGRRLLPPGDRRDLAAALAALAFGLHPVQTEAVTYACGRSASLMATAYLGGLLAYLHARRGPQARWAGVAAGLFLAAGLVRETALTFPAALLLVEARLAALGWARPRPAHWVPSLAAVLLLLGYLAWPAAYGPFITGIQRVPRPGPPGAAALEALGYLGRCLVWPHPLNLDPGLRPPPAYTLAHGATALALLGVLILGGRALRRSPGVALAIAWILLQLLPTLLVPRADLVAEHHLYLALAGVGWLLGGFLAQVSRPALAALGAALVLLPWGALTVRRHGDYRTEAGLWRQSLAANPRNPRAHVNLGVALAAAGDLRGARACFQAALALDPTYAPALDNLDRLPLAPERSGR